MHPEAVDEDAIGGALVLQDKTVSRAEYDHMVLGNGWIGEHHIIFRDRPNGELGPKKLHAASPHGALAKLQPSRCPWIAESASWPRSKSLSAATTQATTHRPLDDPPENQN